MTFEKGVRYRHVNSRDVDLLVVEVSQDGPAWVQLKVFWVSQNSSSLLSADEVKILKDDVSKWKRVQ